MRKTIAMTGATGFAGRHAVTELLKRGHRVVAMARDPARADLPPGVEIIAGHLEDAAALHQLVRGAGAIVHLAGIIAAARAGDYFRYNTFPAKALAQAAFESDVNHFVFASSIAAREPNLSPYGASKLAAEQELSKFNDRLQTLMLRAPAIYGPGDRATLPLFRQLTQRIAFIPGERQQRFSLLYVKDFARILADAVEGEATGTFELSDGTARGYGWNDLIAAAQATEGREIRVLFLPKPVTGGVAFVAAGVAGLTGKAGMVNPGKVRELYHADWVAREPQFPLADPIDFSRGFPETLAWYRAAGWLPRRREAGRSSAFNREAEE